MNRVLYCLCVVAAPLALGACAGGTGIYPSLAIRDAERVKGSALPAGPEVVPAPPPPLGQDLRQRIGQLVADADAAHASFTARSNSAARTVAAARGARAPSDSWVNAQVALADLQSLRSQAVIALADLDGLYTAERLAYPGQPTPSAQAIDEARNTVGGMVEEENRLIAQLSGQLRP